MREFLIQHDGKLEKFPFRWTLLVKKKSEKKHLLQNNNKNISRLEDFNKNTDTSNLDPLKAKIYFHQLKLDLVFFDYPYNQINTMENTKYDTPLIDAHK